MLLFFLKNNSSSCGNLKKLYHLKVYIEVNVERLSSQNVLQSVFHKISLKVAYVL